MGRRFSGIPPPLSTHPSGKYWGKPPALTPPVNKGKGRESRIVPTAQTETICDSIDHSNLRGIFRDLCLWQNHVETVEELANKVTAADWYPLLLGKLAESVVVISGAPNAGKSSLAVNLAKALGLLRTRTASKNFWLFSRSQRPYFSLGYIAQIRSGRKMSQLGIECDNLYHLSLWTRSSVQGRSFLRVTEFLLTQVMQTWPPPSSTMRLPTSFWSREEQSQSRSRNTNFSYRKFWNNFRSLTGWSFWKVKNHKSTLCAKPYKLPS